MSPQLVHVTIGYPPTPMMELLAASSRRSGCRFVVIPRHWWARSFVLLNKISLLRSYLDTGDVDLDGVILFTDAYDVLLTEHSGRIVDKFLATRADILFSAEANFFPAEDRNAVKVQFDDCQSKYRYLNSGGYIGYGWAIKDMLDYCTHRLETGVQGSLAVNDQPLVQDYYLERRSSTQCSVLMDTRPDIFCCLADAEEDFSITRSLIHHKSQGGTISVLHANGNKAKLDILRRYWAMVGGVSGGGADHDFRVATCNGSFLAYHPGLRKLVLAPIVNESTVVFLAKGNRRAIALSPLHGLLTFTPPGGVECDRKIVNVWELLGIRGAVTTHHRSSLGTYVQLENGPAEISLAPLPLHFLQNPAFDNILALAERFDPAASN